MIRKQETEEKARAWLNNICEILTVTGATQEQVKEAIKNSDFRDFEDCLQDECAVHANAILTFPTAVYVMMSGSIEVYDYEWTDEEI